MERKNFEKYLNNIEFDDKPDCAYRDKLEQKLLASLAGQSKKEKTAKWRVGRLIWKFTTAGVILLAVILGINYLGTPIDGASTAFAAAMDSIKQARTFSCIMIMEVDYEDNQTRGKYLSKKKIMFKEPYFKRYEKLTSPWPQYVGEITIEDYDKRRELIVRPAEKMAILYDLSSSYHVDEGTGELSLTMLDTSLRDYLLEKSLGTFDDMGETELDGHTVWKLQSKKKNWISTVWIDPETSYPVQIELRHSEQNRSPILYTSIQIDTDLDDELFSLVPPKDYELKNAGSGGWTDYQRRLVAKIMRLGLLCVLYHDKHENQFPNELSDIVTSGIVTDEAFKNMISPPDEPNGPSMFRYRRPDKGADWSTQIILYEKYEEWPADGIVVCFTDGHSEIMRDQSRFEELMK